MTRTPTSDPRTIGDADVVVVVPNLRLGGAQRAAVNITAALAADGFRTALLTTLGPHTTRFFPNATVAWVDAQSVPISRQRRSGRRSAARIGRGLISAGIRPGAGGPLGRIWTGRSGLALLRAVAGERGERLELLMQQHPPPRVLSMPTRSNVMTAGAVWDLPTRFIPSFRELHGHVEANEPWTSLEALAFRRADVVTANSSESVESIRRAGFPRVALLPNVVTTEPAGRHEHARRFVVVSRLSPEKGIGHAIDAFARISHRLPDWTLDILGDGPIREELERSALRAGLADRVRFRGVTDPLVDLVDGGVFLMTSRATEGSPNALLEALGAGLPVVIWDDVPGTGRLVLDGVSGIRVPPEDVASFADAMLEIADSPRTWARLSEGAVHAVDDHRWPRCRPTYLEVLGLT